MDAGLLRSEVHPTDVMVRKTADGSLEFVSVIEKPASSRLLFVQTQSGHQFHAPPGEFVRRFSLGDSAIFHLVWAVSPITARERWLKTRQPGDVPNERR